MSFSCFSFFPQPHHFYISRGFIFFLSFILSLFLSFFHSLSPSKYIFRYIFPSHYFSSPFLLITSERNDADADDGKLNEPLPRFSFFTLFGGMSEKDRGWKEGREREKEWKDEEKNEKIGGGEMMKLAENAIHDQLLSLRFLPFFFLPPSHLSSISFLSAILSLLY